MIDDMMDKYVMNMIDRYELSMKFLVIDSMNMMDKFEKSMKDQAALKQGSSKTLQGKAPSGKISISYVCSQPQHCRSQNRHPQHFIIKISTLNIIIPNIAINNTLKILHRS